MFPIKLAAIAGMVILLMAFRGAESFGQATAPSEDDPVIALLHQKVDAFFKNLANANVTSEAAFDELVVNSRLAEQPEALKELAKRTKAFDEKFGKFVSSERVATRRVGRDLVLLKYLYKAEGFPVVWYFTYYRDFSNADTTSEAGSWVIVSVRFDTRLDVPAF